MHPFFCFSKLIRLLTFIRGKSEACWTKVVLSLRKLGSEFFYRFLAYVKKKQ